MAVFSMIFWGLADKREEESKWENNNPNGEREIKELWILLRMILILM